MLAKRFGDVKTSRNDLRSMVKNDHFTAGFSFAWQIQQLLREELSTPP